MKTHLFRYKWQGGEYGLEIPADTIYEARSRVEAISATAKYDGVLEAKMPAYVGAWLPRLIVWWKNL